MKKAICFATLLAGICFAVFAQLAERINIQLVANNASEAEFQSWGAMAKSGATMSRDLTEGYYPGASVSTVSLIRLLTNDVIQTINNEFRKYNVNVKNGNVFVAEITTNTSRTDWQVISIVLQITNADYMEWRFQAYQYGIRSAGR